MDGKLPFSRPAQNMHIDGDERGDAFYKVTKPDAHETICNIQSNEEARKITLRVTVKGVQRVQRAKEEAPTAVVSCSLRFSVSKSAHTFTERARDAYQSLKRP